jgi:hypothetical protein
MGAKEMMSPEHALKINGIEWIQTNHRNWERRQIDILKTPYSFLNKQCVFHHDKPKHTYSNILPNNMLCKDCVYRSINMIDVTTHIPNIVEILNKEI